MTEDVASEPLQALLDGKLRAVEFAGGHVVVDAPRRRRVYLPGSFNPLHDGHRSASFLGHPETSLFCSLAACHWKYVRIEAATACAQAADGSGVQGGWRAAGLL